MKLSLSIFAVVMLTASAVAAQSADTKPKPAAKVQFEIGDRLVATGDAFACVSGADVQHVFNNIFSQPFHIYQFMADRQREGDCDQIKTGTAVTVIDINRWEFGTFLRVRQDDGRARDRWTTPPGFRKRD